jgi:hypothetical protein
VFIIKNNVVYAKKQLDVEMVISSERWKERFFIFILRDIDVRLGTLVFSSSPVQIERACICTVLSPTARNQQIFPDKCLNVQGTVSLYMQTFQSLSIRALKGQYHK